LSAVLHSTWNLLAKRATRSDPTACVWLTSALSALLYVPIVGGLAAATRLRRRLIAAALMLGGIIALAHG
jgi:hypothetical protein